MKIRKNVSITLAVIMILSLVLVGGAAAKSADKVDVCHKRGNGTFILINISSAALPDHLSHGDVAPGGAVPGQPGMVFAGDCSLSSTTQQVQTLTVPSTTNNGKKATKVDVCHRRGNGTFILININGNALPAHLQHGDGLPNAAIPNQPGKFLTNTCAISEVPQNELVETLTVPSKPSSGDTYIPVVSSVLENGQLYELRVSGTYSYNNVASDWADAEYFNHGVDGIIQGDNDPIYAAHPNVLDLTITPNPASCTANTDWGVRQDSHEYTKQLTGAGLPLYFCIYDFPYTDNSGSLTVEIWKINW